MGLQDVGDGGGEWCRSFPKDAAKGETGRTWAPGIEFKLRDCWLTSPHSRTRLDRDLSLGSQKCVKRLKARL